MQDSQIYVAIDLETTGLNSSNDEIIDIGAVKFNENGTIDTYSSLIKPNQLISKFITQLTKISNHDVLNAPKIEDVIFIFSKKMKQIWCMICDSSYDVKKSIMIT